MSGHWSFAFETEFAGALHALVGEPAPEPSPSVSAYQFVWPVAELSESSARPSQSSSVSVGSQISCAPGLIAPFYGAQSVLLETWLPVASHALVALPAP